MRAGEIYGIAGVSGNGQAELAEALMGAREPTHGEIWVEELGDIAHAPMTNTRTAAVAVIPADRYTYALAGSLSIADNFAVADIGSGRYGPLGLVDRAAMQRDTAKAIADYDVQGVRSTRAARRAVIGRQRAEARHRPRIQPQPHRRGRP